MKTKITLLILLSVVCSSLGADQQLAGLITQKQWQTLPSMTGDNSHKILENYFKDAQSIRFVTYNVQKLTYKAKFPDFAEIGTITYEKKEGKYYNLQVMNQINPLFFIEKFRKYPVKEKKIKVGDANVYFENGDIYQSSPFGQVLIFKGSWKFEIKPTDEEERLTLMYQTKKEAFSKTGKWGIFILSDEKFVESLNSTGTIGLEDNDIIPLLGIYREYFGIRIKQFNEYWYLPFKQDDNLIIFRKDKNTFFLYDFNGNLNPDTLLRTSPDNNIILSYNSIKSAKLSFRGTDKIDKINLNLFCNPGSNFISGTAKLTFKNPSPFKVLNLSKGLKIKANLDLESKGLSVVRKGRQYYFLGPSTNKFSFFYSGNITPNLDYADIFKKQIATSETTGMDNFFYLSRTQDFYPNSFIDFSETDISISVDRQFECLATGQLIETDKSERNVFRFSSKSAKGISIVCGDFKLAKKIDTKVPINIYSSDFSPKSKQLHIDVKSEPGKYYSSGFDRLNQYFDFKKLKDSFNFLLEKYGDLDINEINILFKRDLKEVGISEKGFVLYLFNPDISISQRIIRNSPILLSNDSTNHLIHELAHQWWGGLFSWKSYSDVWITEGLTQFSVIFFLKKTLSEKGFNRISRKMKRWIYRKNESGPVIYGKRIISIDNDYEAYQSIVYNKAAFIFLMLKEILGEKEFLKRLAHTVEKLKYKSVTSSLFIKTFSDGSESTSRFFNKWVFSRKIPRVTFQAKIKGKKAKIRVEQLDSDFIFPLKIEINTKEGISYENLIIKDKKFFLNLKTNSEIKSIDVSESTTLVQVDIKKADASRSL